MMTPGPLCLVWLLSHHHPSSPSFWMDGYLSRCSSPPDRRLVGKKKTAEEGRRHNAVKTTTTTTTHLHGARAGVAHGGVFVMQAIPTYLPCAWSTSYTRYMRLPRDPSHSLPDLKPSSERTYSHPSAHPPPPCWRRSAYSPRGR